MSVLESTTPSRQCQSVACAASGGVGLSTVHNSPQGLKRAVSPSVVAYGGGELIKVSGGSVKGLQPSGGVRGEVREFSRKSRKRLLEKIAMIDRRKLPRPPVFVTLTYPAEYSPDPERWKRDLDNFCKCILRRYSGAFGIWKLEFQKRGAPHFHLILLGVGFLPSKWLADSWYRIVGSGDPKHRQAGTSVERARSWRGIAAYLSKYIGKNVGPIPAGYKGRFWGVLGRDNFAEHIDAVELVLELPQFYRLRRVLQKWLKRRGYDLRLHRWQGVSAFLDWATASRLLAWIEDG